MRPRVPSAKSVLPVSDAKLLRSARRTPVFLFTRISHIQSGEPVEFVKSIYRGDRYKIVNRLNRVNRELLAGGQAAG